MNVKGRKTLINFLFEAATLKRLQRTGWQILGSGQESVAEHSYMVAVISFILANQLKIDIKKVLIIALFHDIAETRIGDIYKLADFYVEADERKAIQDIFLHLPNGRELIKIAQEYREEKTLESKIVHDADTLALCIELKQLIEKGNIHAKEWFEANVERLKLPLAKKLGEEIRKSNSQDWWKKERQIIHKEYKK